MVGLDLASGGSPGLEPPELGEARKALAEREEPLRHGAEEQRSDQEQPYDRALRVAADLQQPEDVAQSRDQHKGKEYAGQMAPAAEHADASEQRDGDHVELEADRVVGPRIGEPRGEDDSGERRDHAACDEQRQPYAANADARITRDVRIAADGVDAPADRALLQHDCENRRENEKRNDRPREDRSSHRVDAEIGEGVGKLVHRAGAEDDVADAAKQRERAERHDQRRQAEQRDERAVERAAHEPGQQGGEDGERDRGPRPGRRRRTRRCSTPACWRPTDRSRAR